VTSFSPAASRGRSTAANRTKNLNQQSPAGRSVHKNRQKGKKLNGGGCWDDWTPIRSIDQWTGRPISFSSTALLHSRPNHRRRGSPLPFHQPDQELHDLVWVLERVGGVGLLGTLGNKDSEALAPLPQHLRTPWQKKKIIVNMGSKTKQIHLSR
jgi:hypothetical protein